MIRCHECGAALDSMTELSQHECEPEPTQPTPQEAARIRAAVRKREDAENNARTVKRARNDYEGGVSMLVCSLNPARLCDGCMDCMEPQEDAQEDKDAAIDRAYDKLEEEKWKHLK